MLLFKENTGPLPQGASRPALVLRLNYEQRASYRLRLTAEDGTEVGIILPRGSRLCHPYDVLTAEDGTQALIEAAAEELFEARCDDPLLFAKACYHLGNRHLPLQITQGALYFAPDKVIEDLCIKLKLALTKVKKPFEPESGAYSEHSHSCGPHDHEHGHGDHHHHDHDHHEHAPIQPLSWTMPEEGPAEILQIVRKVDEYMHPHGRVRHD